MGDLGIAGWRRCHPSRRDLIAMLGGAALGSPIGVRAQAGSVPVIGFLNGFSPDDRPYLLAAFKQGLGDGGFVEGRTVTIEYRWARAEPDRLPALAAELVARRVDVIVTCGGDASAKAAKHATETIPIVGTIGGDPVTSGLVASINRPGGNFTGVSLMSGVLMAKRLELMREMVPSAATVALLTDATQVQAEANYTAELQAAAQKLNMRVRVLKAGTVADLDTAFATLAADRVDAVLVSPLPIWDTIPIRNRVVALAARRALPTGFYDREQAEAGGTMSYGTSAPGIYHQLGAYTARILKGDRPADLPVMQPTTFELVINLKTAKALGLTVPLSLLATADEVLE